MDGTLTKLCKKGNLETWTVKKIRRIPKTLFPAFWRRKSLKITNKSYIATAFLNFAYQHFCRNSFFFSSPFLPRSTRLLFHRRLVLWDLTSACIFNVVLLTAHSGVDMDEALFRGRGKSDLNKRSGSIHHVTSDGNDSHVTVTDMMTRVSPGSYSYSPARSLSCMSREERKHWSSFQLCFAFIYFRSITLREENGRGWWKSWVSRPAYSSPAPMLFTVLMVFFTLPKGFWVCYSVTGWGFLSEKARVWRWTVVWGETT